MNAPWRLEQKTNNIKNSFVYIILSVKLKQVLTGTVTTIRFIDVPTELYYLSTGQWT